MGANVGKIVQRLLAVLLAVLMTTAGTANVYATSVFGPHLKPQLAQSRAVPCTLHLARHHGPYDLPRSRHRSLCLRPNDPINNSDPNGHICVPCGIGIVAGAIGSLLSSSEPVNAPGPGDEIQDTPEAQILGNMAIGAIPGKPIEQAAVAVGRYFGSRVSVWSMGVATRGFAIEVKLKADLSPAFRTIDSWNPKTGVARSIKSIDLNSPSYRDPRKLESTLKGYLNEIANFQGARGYTRQGQRLNITPGAIKKRELDIAIPGKPTKEQQKSIDK